MKIIKKHDTNNIIIKGKEKNLSHHKVSTDSNASDASSRIRTPSRSILYESSVSVSNTAISINSLLLGEGDVGNYSLLENCKLTGSWKIGEEAVCIGIRSQGRNLRVPSKVFFQEIKLKGYGKSVLVMHHLYDEIHCNIDDGGSFMNLPWDTFMDQTGITEDELWPKRIEEDEEQTNKNLWNAKLYPIKAKDRPTLDLANYYVCCVLSQRHLQGTSQWVHIPPFIVYVTRRAWRLCTKVSMNDISNNYDWLNDLEWRKYLCFRIDEFRIVDWLLSENKSKIFEKGKQIISRMAEEKYSNMFSTFDSILNHCHNNQSTLHLVFTCLTDALLVYASTLDSDVDLDEGHDDDKDPKKRFIQNLVESTMPPLSAVKILINQPKEVSEITRRISKGRKSVMLHLSEEIACNRDQAFLYIVLMKYYAKVTLFIGN